MSRSIPAPSLFGTVVGLWAATASAAAGPFTYRLEVADSAVASPGGVSVTIPVTAWLDHPPVRDPATGAIGHEADQVEAWSLGIAFEGCALEGYDLSGTVSDVALAGDAAGWRKVEVVPGGIVLAVVKRLEARDTLAPEGPHRLLDLTLSGAIAAGEECASCRVRFLDGLEGSGLPVANVVTAGARSFRPSLDDRTVRLHGDLRAGAPAPLLLEEGASESVESAPASILECRREAFYLLDAPLGRRVILRLREEPGGAGATGGLYRIFVRQAGEVGTAAGEHDLASRISSGPSLVIGRILSSRIEVLVAARRVPSGGATVRLAADLGELLLESTSVDRAARGGPLHLRAFGAGFRVGETSFRLERAGATPIPARDVRVLDGATADVLFDLSGLAEGEEDQAYDLTARRPALEGGDLTARLPGALTVKPPEFALGLDVRASGLARYAFDKPSSFLLRIENVSDREIAAPLLRVRGAARNFLGLDEERRAADEAPELRSEPLQILGASRVGPAGFLAPGEVREIPVFFRSRERSGLSSYPFTLAVELFTPPPAALADWALSPPPAGVDPATWEAVRGELPGWLGRFWGDYPEALGEAATRLARRGRSGASVRALFRHLMRRAFGEPSAAAVGHVYDWESEEDAIGALVGAFDAGGTLAGCARSGERGRFAIEGLAEGAAYRLRVSGAGLREGGGDGLEVFVPEGDDLLGVELALEGPGEPFDAAGCPSPPQAAAGLPEAPPALDDAHLTPVARLQTLIVSSLDPNDKEDDLTEIESRLGVLGPRPVQHRITIENTGELAAQRVVVRDHLREGYDLWSFVPRSFSFGSQVISYDAYETQRLVAPGHEDFWSEAGLRLVIPFRSDPVAADSEPRDLVMWVDLHVEPESRTLQWEVRTIDPETEEEPPADPEQGFLPPEDGTGRGDGDFVYEAAPLPDLPEGGNLTNDATIAFDQQPEEYTPTIHRRFTRYPEPEAPAFPVPADSGRLLVGRPLSWAPSRYHAIHYSVTLWKGEEAEPLASASGLLESTWPAGGLETDTEYRWRVVALNVRGGTPQEQSGDRTEGPVWRFRTYPPLPGPPAALAVEGESEPTPTFQWVAGRDATSCAFSLARAGEPWPAEPTATIACTPGESLSRAQPLPAAGEGARWKWRVVSRNARAPEGTAGSAREGPRFPPPAVAPPPPEPPPITPPSPCEGVVCFQRGDADASGVINITDGIYILNWLFLGDPTPPPPCEDAADADDSGAINITDAIYVLNFLFLGGPAPPPPYSDPPLADVGPDPTPDPLDCAQYPRTNP